MYKLKQLKGLALTNKDVFLANLSTMRFRYTCHSFVVRNAAIEVSHVILLHKFIMRQKMKQTIIKENFAATLPQSLFMNIAIFLCRNNCGVIYVRSSPIANVGGHISVTNAHMSYSV